MQAWAGPVGPVGGWRICNSSASNLGVHEVVPGSQHYPEYQCGGRPYTPTLSHVLQVTAQLNYFRRLNPASISLARLRADLWSDVWLIRRFVAHAS